MSSARQPFLPFVITPAKVALVGSSPQIQFADPSDLLADAYVRWCATPEELSRIGPQLHQAASDPANVTMSQVTAAPPPLPPFPTRRTLPSARSAAGRQARARPSRAAAAAAGYRQLHELGRAQAALNFVKIHPLWTP